VTVSGFGAAQAMAQQADLAFTPNGGRLTHGIEEILQRAASEERNTHAYRNQTGHAQQGTKSSVVSESDDHFEAHLEMGEEYSSYLVKRGHSRFDEIAAKAKREAERHVASTAARVAR
jgi:hypothetical protein